MSTSAERPDPTCIITLVHGTWGRGFFPKEYKRRPLSWPLRLMFRPHVPWFHETSWFRRRLEHELRRRHIAVVFRCFAWSGANSVFCRARAASELSELLASDPADKHSIVIAHSHGGNVAFLAITSLGARGNAIHLVTLATPFLRVFPTWSGPAFWEVFVLFSTLIMFGFAFFLRSLSAALGSMMDAAGLGTSAPMIGRVSGFVLLLSVTVVTSVLIVRLINPRPAGLSNGVPRRWHRGSKPWLWRPFVIADATNYESVGPLAPHPLVIRGIDDEAALALAFGAIGNSVSHFMARVIWGNRFQGVMMVSVALLFLLAIAGLPMFETLSARILGVLWSALIITTCVFLLLPSLFNSVFGREFLLGASRCEIAADSAPDSMHATVVTLKPSYSSRRLFPRAKGRGRRSMERASLRHAIYDYPNCVPEIIKWMEKRGLFNRHPQTGNG
jgi:hypothetical protein